MPSFKYALYFHNTKDHINFLINSFPNHFNSSSYFHIHYFIFSRHINLSCFTSSSLFRHTTAKKNPQSYWTYMYVCLWQYIVVYFKQWMESERRWKTNKKKELGSIYFDIIRLWNITYNNSFRSNKDRGSKRLKLSKAHFFHGFILISFLFHTFWFEKMQMRWFLVSSVNRIFKLFLLSTKANAYTASVKYQLISHMKLNLFCLRENKIYIFEYPVAISKMLPWHHHLIRFHYQLSFAVDLCNVN